MRSAFPPTSPEAPDPWLAWLLPLALIVVSVLLVGSHYEAPDDTMLTYVLSDRPIIGQIAFWRQTYVYLVGTSGLLAALYQRTPDVPWYGLFLYAGLYLAVGLVFSLLLRTVLRATSRGLSALLLTLFFALFFLEHILFFTFTRIALLTAGAALAWLFYDRAYFRGRPGRWLLPGVALLLSASIRTHSTAMAVLLLGPPLLLLTYWLDHSRRRLIKRAGALAGLTVVLVGVNYVFSNRVNNLLLKPASLFGAYAGVVDYHHHFFASNLSPSDQTRAAAVERMIFADSGSGLDPAFFKRSGGFQLKRYAREVLVKRVVELAQINANFVGQWLLLALLGGVLWRASARRSDRYGLLLAGAYFLAFLAGLMFLKLPHRVVASAVSLAGFALVPAAQIAGLWQPAFLRRRAVLAALTLATLFHLGYTALRSRKYHAQQVTNEAVLAAINSRYAGHLLLEGVFGTYYSCLHPLKVYPLHAVPSIPLDRWPTALVWFPAHCRALVGTDTWAQTLEAAARRPDARWLLTPAYAALLHQYFERIHGTSLSFLPVGDTPIYPGTWLREYRAVPPAALPAQASAVGSRRP